MSSFFKLNKNYLLCASPERFLKKQGNKIISQPIKGTIARSANRAENEHLQQLLRHNEKEQAENVMIVDLVRNDLNRCALVGSVQVEELFGCYTFNTVNHLISTISAQVTDSTHVVDVLKNCFPMGSMTGAPKVEVMKNITRYEDQQRGIYSGALGYISPDGDADFNVVIRSLVYDAASGYLSAQVGSAITYDSQPQQEYDELQLKLQALKEALKT